MQLKHLFYFVTTAECGSINKAARKLYLSPQALSGAIAGLERELGFSLFYRQRSGVTLTREGQCVLEDARTIVALSERWKTLRQAADPEPAAAPVAVNVNVNVSLALAVSFNRFLIELEQAHPGIHVTVNEGRGKRLMDEMKKGFSGLSLFSLTDEYYKDLEEAKAQYGWQVCRLMEDEFAIVLGRNYFPKCQGMLTLEDCRKMTLILAADQNDVISRRYSSLFGGCLQAGVESYSSILYMVEQNKGVVVLPRRIVCCEPMYAAGLLRVMPVRGLHIRTSHYMVCSGAAMDAPQVQQAAGLIKRYYTREEWKHL